MGPRLSRACTAWEPLGLHLPLVQCAAAIAMAVLALAPAIGAKLPEPRRLTLMQADGGLSYTGLQRLEAALGPGGRLVVARLEARGGASDAERLPGWTMIDLGNVPTLGIGSLQGAEAQLVNAMIPNSGLPVEAAFPFRLARLDTPSGKRALRCLTEAIYFEAGRDSEPAQAAVAQVVLNRVRHPAYPDTVCGVVYQGAMRTTGCQFSFTCDGSLKLGHMRSYWARAEAVARRALQGYVAPEVGVSTNYHADYVAPYWARTVVRVSQVGPHIFYRWTGPLGQRAALTDRYGGDETNISQQVLASWDYRTQGVDEAMALKDVAGPANEAAHAVRVLEEHGLVAKVEGGRVRALLNPTPRKPTAEEVKAINARMEVIEKGLNPVKQPSLDEPGEAAPPPKG